MENGLSLEVSLGLPCHAQSASSSVAAIAVSRGPEIPADENSSGSQEILLWAGLLVGLGCAALTARSTFNKRKVQQRGQVPLTGNSTPCALQPVWSIWQTGTTSIEKIT